MKNKIKILLIGIVLLLQSCSEYHFYTKQFCEQDKALYLKLFSICMQGQRHTTGTDDADDFVTECNRVANNQSLNNCNQYLYVQVNSWDGSQLELAEACKDTKKESYIKACRGYGFTYER